MAGKAKAPAASAENRILRRVSVTWARSAAAEGVHHCKSAAKFGRISHLRPDERNGPIAALQIILRDQLVLARARSQQRQEAAGVLLVELHQPDLVTP